MTSRRRILVLLLLVSLTQAFAAAQGKWFTAQNGAVVPQAANATPVIDYVFPTSGSGPGTVFIFAARDDNGWQDLKTLRIYFNTTAVPQGGCAMEYDVASGKAQVYDESRGGWMTDRFDPNTFFQFSVPTKGCKLVYGYAAGQSLWQYFYIIPLFRQPVGTVLHIFVSADDKSGATTGWVDSGTWTVQANQPPTNLSMTPGSGTGTHQGFTFTFADPNGASDIFQAAVQIQDASAQRQCNFQLVPISNFVSFGGQFGYTDYNPGVLTSQYCNLDLRQSWFVKDGNNLMVHLGIAFNAGFEGQKNVTMYAQDFSNAVAPVATMGTWTVGSAPGPTPVITLEGVTNGASFARGGVAPGEIVTIFGTGLGPDAIAYAHYESVYLGTYAGSTLVYFDDVPAPMIYGLAPQVSTIVPYFVNGTTRVRVEYQGRSSNEVVVPVVATAPGIFRSGSQAQGVIVNQDYSFNSDKSPAPRGSIITLFETGEGQTVPSGLDGILPQVGQWPKPAGAVRVLFGDVAGDLQFSGLTYAGVMQVNVRVPDNAPTGPSVPLVIEIGGNRSPDGTTVAVQ